MGCFPKLDGTVPKQTKDAAGRLVNERGYLVTREGHICNRAGKILFQKECLKGGEFPKFFHFSKFPKNRFLGDLATDAKGNAAPTKDRSGKYVDLKGRATNKRGYLIDAKGNVVDVLGNIMFEKALLGKEGDLPELFRQQTEKTRESQDELDDLINRINNNAAAAAAEDEFAIEDARGTSPPRRSQAKALRESAEGAS